VDDRYCGALLMLGAAAFDAARFSINTDVEGLISQKSAMASARTGVVPRLFQKKAFWLS
jgi:hypothetical protein